MKTFTDNAGRTWTVAINVDAIKRVRSLLDEDLLEIVEGKLIERLIRDPVLLCDVVYAVCKPEADEQGVSDEDFGRAMAGDAIEHATKALLEDLVDFFQNRRDRENLRRVLGVMQQVMDRARDLIEQRIEAGELERIAENRLEAVARRLEEEAAAAPAPPASRLQTRTAAHLAVRGNRRRRARQADAARAAGDGRGEGPRRVVAHQCADGPDRQLPSRPEEDAGVQAGRLRSVQQAARAGPRRRERAQGGLHQWKAGGCSPEAGGLNNAG